MTRWKKLMLLVLGILAFPSLTYAKNPRLDYVKAQLIKSGFKKATVTAFFTRKELRLLPNKKVAYKKPDWPAVERQLLSQASMKICRDFFDANQETFARVEKDFGVPKEDLLGLIATETMCGQNVGSYLAVNSLYSRMIYWPADKWLGQANELIALSSFCLENGVDCFKIKSSYAGAFGLVQFMPTALKGYGIDGDGDGQIDLFNPVDAIPSAANFLAKHGWDQDKVKSLTRYYGSPVGYPAIVLRYGQTVRAGQ